MSQATYATLVGRTTAALREGLAEAGTEPGWLEATAKALLMHIAAEVICCEEANGATLTATEVARWICDELEGQP